MSSMITNLELIFFLVLFKLKWSEKFMISFHQMMLGFVMFTENIVGDVEEEQTMIWILVIYVSMAAGKSYHWLHPLAFGVMGSRMKTRVCQTHLCGNEW